MAAIAGGTAPTGTVIEAVPPVGSDGFPFAGLLDAAKAGDTGTRAYLNILLFDENLTFLDAAFVPVTTAAKENGTNVPHEKLSGEIVVQQPGYAYIYFSNDNGQPLEVFFDDFTVTHSHSAIVQADDYYPFGLTFNSYQRVSATANNFKFQGQEHIDDLGLNWVQFKWRNHDPAIGRFFNVDPLAESYVYNSPYAFAENKVISNFELEGLEAVSIHLRAFHPSKTFGGGFSGDNRGFSNSPSSTARVKTSVNIDFNQSSPKISGGTQTSDPSHHPVLGVATAPDRKALSNVNIGETSTGAKMVGFQTELEGANPLTPSFATPNIDVDGTFSISSNQETGMLSISANVTGDKFPSTESFITDASGNSVYIGVGAFEGSPMDLKGEGGKEIINNSLQIKFNGDGNFQNVIYQGQQYNIEDYNNLFQNVNASGN